MGTIPAVVIGFFFEDAIGGLRAEYNDRRLGIDHRFFTHVSCGTKSDRRGREPSGRLGWRLGWFQALALFPGISRSGATISGALFAGFTREQATRFAFLLSFPVLLGGGIMSLLEMIKMPFPAVSVIALSSAAVAALFAGLCAIHFLLRFVATRSFLSRLSGTGSSSLLSSFSFHSRFLKSKRERHRVIAFIVPSRGVDC